MTKIAWNTVGERLFEAGVDRGVLYIEDDPGVPWNGLISVTETVRGGEVTPLYVDGIKYLNMVASQDFEATIEAYTYPEEFNQCDGTLVVANGLFATQQAKKSFNLSYRTKVGNDLLGADYAYKIHLVYNATASPASDRLINSISNIVTPLNFTWKLTTLAPNVVGVAPTAHFFIDSREVPPALLSIIEDILYGTDMLAPRIPSVLELMFIFDNYQSTTYDAGTLSESYYAFIDAGMLSESYSETIDPGGP